jgi:outer membrane protein OmpA-like peptidoglycan-associated protein
MRVTVKTRCRAGSINWVNIARLLALICLTSGYGKDVFGANEHPALPSVPGSKVVASERKEQGEMIIPLERVVFDLQTQKFNNFKTVSASGPLMRTLYELPTQTTPQEVARYYETSLSEAKGEILFSGAQGALDNGNDRFVDQIYRGREPDRIYNLLLLNRDNAYLAGKYNWNGRDIYVQVYTFANSEGRSTNLVRKGRVGALVETVEAGPTHPPTPLVTSEQMAEEINRTGRIALYGLYFDTGRTEIKSESKPTLEQIADLLKRERNLKLLVVGHTDNVGTFEANRDLSQRRAESVVNALVTGFGIAPESLIPFGVSYAAPVASNATPEGRSQNRRVELVRY